MCDDAFSVAGQPAIERIAERRGHVRRHAAASQMFFSKLPLLLPMTRAHLIQIDAQVFALAREAEEKILQGEIVKDGDARNRAHRLDDSRVIAMVVADVINDRIKARQLLLDGLAFVVNAGKLRQQLFVTGTKTVNEERYVRALGQPRQKFFAVV